MGILHIEDLPVEEFIDAIRKLNEYDITEKIDGFNIRFGIDENGFYTKGKDSIAKRQISEYGNEFRYSGFKSAHAALAKILPDLLKTNLIQIGDEIEAEVLYGQMPNTVPYKGDTNKIIFIKETKGNPKLLEIKQQLENKAITTKVNIPRTFDGKTIKNVTETHKWVFTQTPRINPIYVKKIQNDLEFNKLLNDLELFLTQNSGVANFSNIELISLPLNKKPDKIDIEEWRNIKEEIKTKRKTIRDYVMNHKLNIKAKLLNNLVRQVQSGFGPDINDGGWIEGLVLRNDDRVFKLVDKDVFTELNKFNWHVRNKLGGNAKGIEKIDSLVGRIKVALGKAVGHPELGTSYRNRYIKNNNITKRTLINDINDFHKTKEKFIKILDKGLQILSRYHLMYEKLKNKKEIQLNFDGLRRKFKITSAHDEKNLEAFAELYDLLESLQNKARQAKTKQDLIELLIDPTTNISESVKQLIVNLPLVERVDTEKTLEIYGQKLKLKFRDDSSAPSLGLSNTQIIINSIDMIKNKIDPSPNNEYTLWVIRKYIDGGIRSWEDMDEAHHYLTLFHKLKKKQKFKTKYSSDINQYKSLGDLGDAVLEFQEKAVTKKGEEEELLKNNEAKIIYNSNNLKVVIPLSEKASCFYGRNTRWCTAATQGNNPFQEYNLKGPLYIIILKKENKRYQLHFEDHQFMDEKDNEIEIIAFLKEYPEIVKAIPQIKYHGKDKWQIGNRWYDDEGELHREDGPALVRISTSAYNIVEYYIHGALEGPIINGIKMPGSIRTFSGGRRLFFNWYKNGLLHREEGPAIIEFVNPRQLGYTDVPNKLFLYRYSYYEYGARAAAININFDFKNPTIESDGYKGTEIVKRISWKELEKLTQEIIDKYVPDLIKKQYQLNESENEHAKALQQTGFWGRRGAGVIPVAETTGKVLLPLRSAQVEQPLTWGVWGGAIDSNENPLEAAIREFREESGYKGKILNSKHIHTFAKDSFRYDTYLITIPDEFKPKLNWESKDAQWFKKGQWPSPLHFGLKDIIQHNKLVEQKLFEYNKQDIINKYAKPFYKKFANDEPASIAPEVAIYASLHGLDNYLQQNNIQKTIDPYVKWIVHRYVTDGIRYWEDVLSKVVPALEIYDKLKKKNKLEPSERDINKIKSEEELLDLVDKYREEELASNSEKEKKIENNFYKSNEAELLYDTDEYKIVVPKTHEASCFFGRNTRWCTTSKNESSTFLSYIKRGPLYIILHKPTNRRWQFHFESIQFMNERDKQIDFAEFFDEHHEVIEFFKDKFIKIFKKNRIITILIEFFSDDLNDSELKYYLIHNPEYIKYVNNPSENLQMYVVKKKPLSIEYINNPSERVQWIAAKSLINLFRPFDDNPKKDVVRVLKQYIDNEKILKKAMKLLDEIKN